MYKTTINDRINYASYLSDVSNLERLRLIWNIKKYGSLINPVHFTFSSPWNQNKKQSMYPMTFTFQSSKIKFKRVKN